jgi:hypothetical protein
VGIFGRRRDNSRVDQGALSASPLQHVDLSLPDGEWFSASERIYNETWRSHLGSPETFASAGRNHHSNQNFGVALLFFGKSIDLLHTLYVCSDTVTRRPSTADRGITSGFIASLRATIDSHPNAPIDESVREATHRRGRLARRASAQELLPICT